MRLSLSNKRVVGSLGLTRGAVLALVAVACLWIGFWSANFHLVLAFYSGCGMGFFLFKKSAVKSQRSLWATELNRTDDIGSEFEADRSPGGGCLEEQIRKLCASSRAARSVREHS